MYLSIATTHRPATDLGYLLMKHPGRLHEAELSFGRAVMCFPEAEEARCAFALALDIDPVALVRDRRARTVAEYVNDRPYAASSFLSVALAKALGTAMNGRSRERPELAAEAIPLEATVGPLPVREDGAAIRRLFEPLGWAVRVERGEGDRLGVLHLSGTARLAELLAHLYVLVPVLDRAKHYWIGPDEVEKLIAKGGDWLATHPARDEIAHAYLKGRRGYVSDALERLDELALPAADGIEADGTARDGNAADPEEALERPVSLNTRRHEAVEAVVRDLGAARVADLGCAEGRLAARLARLAGVREVLAIDASSGILDRAERALERLPAGAREKITLAHGALGYRDRRLDGVDMALLVEVVEHLDPARLGPAMDALFASGPRTVLVTTPNREHNAVFGLAEGQLRHPDHRFEWTRAEFRDWAEALAARHGRTVELRGIGEDDPAVGPPTQMALFRESGGGAS